VNGESVRVSACAHERNASASLTSREGSMLVDTSVGACRCGREGAR